MAIISRSASYGLRTMCRLAELAAADKAATIAWLAESEHLPKKYLEQVLRELKQAGLVDSRSGPGGGCRLAKPADQITVGDVVRALDGEIRPGHCLEESHAHDASDCPGCWGMKTCSVREVWVQLQTSINESLDAFTIAQLVERQRELTGVSGQDYQI